MRGEVSFKSDEELLKFFQIFIDNRDKPLFLVPSTITSLLTLPAAILSLPVGIVGRLVPSNILTTARQNISAHYDLGNDMFRVFLSKDMTYSCAIFPSLDADLKISNARAGATPRPSPNGEPVEDPLHDAQMRKLQHIIHKADIRPGHRVLEIGSGWGSLALAITRGVPHTTVDTLTLSVEQAEHVRALVRGGDARVRVHLLDFRAMPAEWRGRFDRVVSVEMVEAIGADMYETYFAAIDWALKPQTGVGVVQGITIPEARYDAYAKSEDFINKWVRLPLPWLLALFPGGILPTVTHLTDAIVTGSSQRLLVESVENIGPHYARTLREWRRRFDSGFGDIAQALKAKYPETMNDTPEGIREVEMFRRKWIYYFCYCEAGFSTRTLGDHIITFTKEGNVEYGCQVFV
ncbi:hypothetical protein PHLGIDRAFT_87325 [Phlebiopsis gigantea 11061_1 CR5-6]|uniref:Cyclopropane-fatty-acyl-phospholipid synthase n=1 Tax=Phlebiopsis gigantea (strain 11061_1 CR5-6) TaxID=745531 RepID=A0A0C3SCQ5_PHLG1|nr:hypothetical protein PHLGIDRAFT_87325 [Phlebiopsis gigantea 11061_1 CR5-6]